MRPGARPHLAQRREPALGALSPSNMAQASPLTDAREIGVGRFDIQCNKISDPTHSLKDSTSALLCQAHHLATVGRGQASARLSPVLTQLRSGIDRKVKEP